MKCVECGSERIVKEPKISGLMCENCGFHQPYHDEREETNWLRYGQLEGVSNNTSGLCAMEFQGNVDPAYISESPMKYAIGRLLVFVKYDKGEPTGFFKESDVLRVLPENGCGMGIDVIRLSDHRKDMVWPTEVKILRTRSKQTSSS